MWYEVLGVDESASFQDVTNAYNQLYNSVDDVELIEVIDAYLVACEIFGVKQKKKRKKRIGILGKFAIIYVSVLSVFLMLFAVNEFNDVLKSNMYSKCLENLDNDDEFDEKIILNKILKQGYSYIDTVDEVASFYKEIDDSTVYFDFILDGEFQGCSFSIIQEVSFVYENEDIFVNRSVASSGIELNMFSYNVYYYNPDSDDDSIFIIMQDITTTQSRKFLKIENKEDYAGTDFYNFMSEDQLIKDRDILVGEVEKYVKEES